MISDVLLALETEFLLNFFFLIIILFGSIQVSTSLQKLTLNL